MVTEFIFPSDESPSSGSVRAKINSVEFVADGCGLRPDQSLADVPSQTVGAGLLAKASAQAMIFWLTEYISIPAVTAT